MLDPEDWRGVIEVDPGTNRVVQRIDTGDTAGVVATPDVVWVSSGAAGTLKRLDRRAGLRRSVVRVDGSPEAMRLFRGRLWVLDTLGRLLALDVSTGRVVMIVALGERVGSLTDDGRRLWMAASPGRRLLAVDPRTGRVSRYRYRGGAGPSVVVFDGRRLWVGNGRENSVTAVDPRTGRALKTVRLGPRAPTSWVPVPTWIEVVHGRLWVGHVVRVTGDSWRASVIDPTTGRRVATQWVPAGSGELATDGTAVWIQSGSSVARVDPTAGSFDVTR
ncbi:PQQ-binding-like beta-propeller repeat protein [Kineosporia sp. A_224]|uniref:outer membrane protein assembly factor BamB family protein n=1 Tax=Kineosporia sp. A_224 TaxID=1962180 RepID=UPI00117BB5C7|nr:PQQ-binding-like beta-propeller repeat protein [Kineosporia sp. A_224]